MAWSVRVCMLQLFLTWFRIASCVYCNYYSRSRFPSQYSAYRPMSYCIRMVYGRRRFCPFSHPFINSRINFQSFNELDAEKDIKRSYGDMFLTVEELKKTLRMDRSSNINWKNGVQVPRKSVNTIDGSTGNEFKTSSTFRGDIFEVNSDCCSTTEVFFVNKTMTDIDNIPRKIAQLPKIGAYQFIRHGLCANKGACQGTCVQHFINLPLAVDEPGSSGFPISFRFFSVPGYCSCRFIGF